MRFQRKVARVQKLHRGVRIVPSKTFRSGRNEIRVMLSPDRQRRRRPLPEIFLESRIEPDIVGVVQKQIQLNIDIARPRQQGRIQRIDS